VAPVAAYFVFPDNLVLGSQVIIAALFALSLDVVLGYAGITSLGHAAFFGLGAYTAGLLAAHGWGEPLTGLVVAAVVAAVVGYLTSFLVVRGSALAQLMITLGVDLLLREAARSRNTRLSLADHLAEIFEEARRSGLANEDWAVGQYRMAQKRAKQGSGR